MHFLLTVISFLASVLSIDGHNSDPQASLDKLDDHYSENSSGFNYSDRSQMASPFMDVPIVSEVEDSVDSFVKFLKTFISDKGLDLERFESHAHFIRQIFQRILKGADQVVPSKRLLRQLKHSKHMHDSMFYAAKVLKSHQSNDTRSQLVQRILQINIKLLNSFDSCGNPDARSQSLRSVMSVHTSVDYLQAIYTELPKIPVQEEQVFDIQYEIAKMQISILVKYFLYKGSRVSDCS